VVGISWLPTTTRIGTRPVVSLFESHGRKLVAAAGKDGVLHVLDRNDGKRVFTLPVTTVVNHDKPVTGRRNSRMPGGWRAMERAGVQPHTGLLLCQCH